jgi:hypothetical protein
MCRPRNRQKLIDKIIRGNPDRLLTITLRKGMYPTLAEGKDALSRTWRAARKEWRRLHPGRKLPWHGIWELQKNGTPHLHVAMRGCFIAQRWLSNFMDRHLNSPIVDIRHLDNPGRVAHYLGKYLAKEIVAEMPGKRHYGSPDYEVTKPVPMYPGMAWRKSNQPMGLALLLHGVILNGPMAATRNFIETIIPEPTRAPP